MAEPTCSEFVLFDDQVTGKQLWFTDPVDILTLNMGEDIDDFFALIELYKVQGYYLAGLFHYEFGLALEARLSGRVANNTPLARFGVFNTPSDTPPAKNLYRAAPIRLNLEPDWSATDYLNRFKSVQNYLRAGDCYQINLTFPMRAKTTTHATDIFTSFRRRQPGRYGAHLSLGGADIISFSPELFFEKQGRNMRMRPMKGTRARSDDDAADAQAMLDEPKSQAENLMIVDLLRNDLSRLSKPGSVQVPELFTLETYPTLHQMTSQVTSTLRPDQDWRDILAGLFPCGSVTGAPKIRAMEIIDDLEEPPRGAYCGAIGFIRPNGDAVFNVGIRTVTLENGQLCYPVGSGVVLDSDGLDEYKECLLKASLLTPIEPELIETFQWNIDDGYIRIERHLDRLCDAARQMGWLFTKAKARAAIPKLGTGAPQRCRLTLDATGAFHFSHQDLVTLASPLTIALSRYDLDSDIQQTGRKISERDFYDGERDRLAKSQGVDEVIFLNTKGHLCEGSFTSIILEIEGQLYTPPLLTGALPGVLRAELIDTDQVKIKQLSLDDMFTCDQIWLGNSLRGLMPARLISKTRL